MEPVSAGIMVGGSLLTALMQQKAAAEKEKRDRLLQAEMQGFDAQKQGAGAMGEANQSALAKLMEIYSRSLG